MAKKSPHAPHPEKGWSREVRVLPDAVVIPDATRGNSKVCGVLDNGNEVLETNLFRWEQRFFRKPDAPEGDIETLPGRHMWGGYVFHHFGHFLCESTARLWAARSENVDSIVFAPRTSDIRKLASYQMRLLELLGVDLPVRLIDAPTRVEELVIPGQGFGLGVIARGTPEFRAMMADMAARIEPQGDARIYISRTGVGGSGGILNEDVIEANMARCGYTIYHPQRHSLDAQLAQYKAATHIVGLDSSAFHLAGFVAHAGQRYGIVLRRNMGAYYNLQRQVESFGSTTPDIINALVGDWMPAGKRKPNRLSMGEIDHAALGQRLKDLGYIAPDAEWHVPDADVYDQSVARIKRKLGADAELRPIAERIEVQMAGQL